MPPLDSVFAVILAGLALSVSPGPSMLYVLSRSVGQSRAAGLASAIGLGLGGVFLAIAAAWGLGLVVARYDWVLVTLRYVGSAYLIWLGYGLFRDARASAQVTFEAEAVTHSPFSTIVWQGILVEVLNPKTILFFVLFIPPFVSADVCGTMGTSLRLQLLVLGILVPLTAVPSDLLVAYMGGTMRRMVNRHQSVRKYMGWIGGLVLIGIALNLLFGGTSDGPYCGIGL